jgi:RimJ/RimL family protein N-acetyltransferase
MAVMAQISKPFIFNHNPDTDQISCRIETDRLILESLDENRHCEAYVRIFGNQANFDKYGTGEAWAVEKTIDRVNSWHKRWMKGNPFSALAIIRKEDRRIIGHWVTGGGSSPGISEVAYIIDKPYQNNKYGTEAARAVMDRLVPQLLRYNVEGAPFKGIEVTVRPDNHASWKILERIGFTHVTNISKYEAERKLYEYPVRDPKDS